MAHRDGAPTRSRGRLRYGVVLLVWLVAGANAAAPVGPSPLPQAHAHNDYEHERPLLDALAHGFCSVEADIWLVEGQLLVAHDRRDARPDRTLQRLYLDPLQERVRQNGGRVYPQGPVVTLMIDLKSEAEATYAVLRNLLAGYTNMLTHFTPTSTVPGAVTVILSGNRPTARVAAEPWRWVAIDGRLADLERNPSPHLMPLISDNWILHFRWRGTGDMPEEERQKLRELVQRTHQQGRRLRFWATPDNPPMWAALQAAGVDLLNTDDLGGLRAFLTKSK
ncbi:phosphatidylinositol-specific phospholipase C/glycerophosphodiester phosphodiesterase family protein [Fontisphaera persica]|uniref:phosphatidylinositol-specific phospholipase C/glycerophosphodiester phosphodiesterase family protein n=1 Tax=Fontisphaera persica TaxID=2974023 RepID=UPI003CCE2E4D